MNNFDIYIPIDVRGPIKTGSRANVQLHSTNNPVIMFQLFTGPFPLMLDDASSVSIAFTNERNENVKGSGDLQIVNPHRGTISYVLDKNDITMSGLHTVTIGITTNKSFFTVQTNIFAQDLSDDLYNILTGDDSDSSSKPNCAYTYGTDFPCAWYNPYCRLCRRCKWVWENNTYPKPLCFEEIKMCKNPFVTPPIVNFANLPNEYEKAGYPTMMNDDGELVVYINDTQYICDIGQDGALYLKDKSLEVPKELVGLYLGSGAVTYYKISEKLPEDELHNNSNDNLDNDNDNTVFDVNSLFDN